MLTRVSTRRPSYDPGGKANQLEPGADAGAGDLNFASRRHTEQVATRAHLPALCPGRADAYAPVQGYTVARSPVYGHAFTAAPHLYPCAGAPCVAAKRHARVHLTALF